MSNAAANDLKELRDSLREVDEMLLNDEENEEVLQVCFLQTLWGEWSSTAKILYMKEIVCQEAVFSFVSIKLYVLMIIWSPSMPCS